MLISFSQHPFNIESKLGPRLVPPVGLHHDIFDSITSSAFGAIRSMSVTTRKVIPDTIPLLDAHSIILLTLSSDSSRDLAAQV